jgi:subtilisin family serine protease
LALHLRRAAFPLALGLTLSALPAAEVTPPERITSPQVEAALSAAPSARVVIYLDLPGEAALTPAQRKVQVARVQEPVLTALSPKDFTPRWRFETVPALAGEVTAAGVAKLEGLPGVLKVDLDIPVQADLAESVPLIKASQVQSLGYRGQGVTVAILDTGVDTDHPDLSDDLVDQECFCTGCCPNGTNRQSGPGSAEDANGHGSNVAGIVTAKGVLSPWGWLPMPTSSPSACWTPTATASWATSGRRSIGWRPTAPT